MKNAIKNVNARHGGTDKLFNFRPTFFVAIFLCFGITFAYLRFAYGISSLWKLLFLPVLLLPLLYYSTNGGQRKTGLATALILFFLIGEFSFTYKIEDYFDKPVYENTPTTVYGVVVEKREYENSARVILDELIIDEKSEKGKLIAYLPLSFAENIQNSDKIFLRGSVSNREIYANSAYLIGDIERGIRYDIAEVEEYKKVEGEFRLFAYLGNLMRERIYKGMDETSASATVALLIGDMSGIEEGLMDNIRYGGIAHVFSVSGMNVGALYAFCLCIIQWKMKGVNKLFRFLFLFSLVFLYTGVCGFVPSVTRASIICLISYANRLFGAKEDFLESLGLSAILILLVNPFSLFNVGFQLSFMACLGLALFTQPFAKPLWKLGVKIVGEIEEDAPLNIRQRMMRSIVNFVAACIGAQIATMPIQLNAFGYVSGWALLLNCIFVPLISAMFSITLVLVSLACVLPSLFTYLLLYPPSAVWSLLLLTFETADFSSFAVTGLTMSAPACICYYGACQFMQDKWNISPRVKWSLFIAFLLSFGYTMVALNG